MRSATELKILAFLVLAATVQLLGLQASHAQTGDVRDVPDPAIIKHGEAYIIFSTAEGIPIRRSEDLIHWEVVGHVFEELPAWVEEEVPGVAVPWAPDIAFFNDRYHLYYSLSTFGSQRSVIALATNQTLDPADPAYAWVDRGKVVESHPGVDDFNAIDPNVAFDESGHPWLAWGSHWGGIRMRRLDPDTGLPAAEDTTVYALASRLEHPRAIEAPFIIRHGDFFYLFVSFDQCCEGAESTYKVMVGRSEAITGPYVDRAGVPMMQGGGTLVLAGSGDIRGPGHNAILTDDDGKQYMVHHYVNVKEGPASPDAPLAIPRSLQIRPLHWEEEGWPTAGEPLTEPR
jgi:arabinan endo-1,5-alpha-L-arabinosidase